MLGWQKVLEEMSKYSPFGITDLFRSSYMDNPNFYEAWKQGMEQDGSSTGFLYLDEVGASLDKGRAYLRLGAGHDQILNRMLRARVGKGRNLYLAGEGRCGTIFARRTAYFYGGRRLVFDNAGRNFGGNMLCSYISYGHVSCLIIR